MPAPDVLKQLDELIKRNVNEALKTAGVIVPRATGMMAGDSRPTTAPLAALSALAQQVQPAADGQYRESRVIQGFNLVATDPPSEIIRLTNSVARSGSPIISQGLSDGRYQKMVGEAQIGLHAYLNPNETRVIYIGYDEGYHINVGPPLNQLLCGKVVIPAGALAIRDDRSDETMDGYIVDHADPFFDNSARVDDDTIAAFGNMLQTIFARNIFGNITLSEALKIISADSRVVLSDKGLTISDNNGNILASFTKEAVSFYDTSGRMLATFGPDGNKISAFDILDEHTLAIRDNQDTTRVLLGMLTSDPKQTWGFEMFDEKGKTFMSTTKNRAWFAGAKINAAILAVPFYALIFASLQSTSSCIGTNDLDRSPYSQYTQQTVSLLPLPPSPQLYTESIGMVFDGFAVWAGVRSLSEANVYIYRTDVLDNSVTAFDMSALGYTVGPSYYSMVVAKNHIFFGLGGNINAIDLYDTTKTYLSSSGSGIIYGAAYDGLYLYISRGVEPDIWIEKHSINSDMTLTLEGTLVLTGIGGTGNMVFDGDYLYFTQVPTTMYKIDVSTMTVDTSASIDSSGALIEGTVYDGRHLWTYVQATAPNIGFLHKIDPTDLSVLASVPLSTTGYLGQPVFDGQNIWIPPYTSTGNTNVYRVDVISNAVSGTTTITTGRKYAVYDGLNLWTKWGFTMERTPLH